MYLYTHPSILAPQLLYIIWRVLNTSSNTQSTVKNNIEGAQGRFSFNSYPHFALIEGRGKRVPAPSFCSALLLCFDGVPWSSSSLDLDVGFFSMTVWRLRPIHILEIVTRTSTTLCYNIQPYFKSNTPRKSVATRTQAATSIPPIHAVCLKSSPY